jgi:serine protease Do
VTKDLWLESKGQKVQRERSELSKVARSALPAVVSITAYESSSGKEGLEGAPTIPQRALGSGFFIHPDGYILTSYHVVEDGDEIRVFRHATEDAGPQTYLATLIGKDEETDVALLKIDSPRKFPVLPLGNTESVDVADWVVVIGNPYGMANSVTVGVVSYKGRTGIAPNGKDGYFDYLQTDASINPGNSGGPVLDLNGTVVAIASAINVSAQGIGFALPIEVAKAVLPQLSTQGSVRRSWMGISVRDASDSQELEAAEGVVVANVLSGGPASEAGLKVGDVIVRVGSTAIRRAAALRWKVALGQVGKLMDLTVHRRGKPLHLKVRLAETPAALEDDVYSRPPEDPEDSTVQAVPAEQAPSHE